MIRALLALAAVLIVVLAFIFDRPWLYGAAAASLVGVLGVLGLRFWEAYRQNVASDSRAGSDAAEDTLEDLGIMNVRPQEREPTAEERPETDSSAAMAEEEESSPPQAVQDGAGEPPDEWPENSLSEGEMASMTSRDMEASTTDYSEDRPVLGPFLESLRAAVGAQSVCLLVQEEVALEYRIEALASVQPSVQYTGSFGTQEPLLSATMSHQPVTVRSFDESSRRELGYYDSAPAITQIALAPVALSDSPATVFLLADATREVDLGASRVRSLLARFADTVPLLLDLDTSEQEGSLASQSSFARAEDQASAPAVDGEPSNRRVEEEAPRPRREIIAEEMQTAEAASDDLALVLVHLNRAESIARQGDKAVTSAERHLRSRLEDLAPGQRVERFGELTYGIFVRSGVHEVEEWAADLQDAMAREIGELEGGVSVGVAIRHDRHDPDGLRADATDALLEAYETGTCTIIA